MTDRTPCVIFDLDGTLADCSHRRHHVDKRVQCEDCEGSGSTVARLVEPCPRCRGAGWVAKRQDWPAFYEGMVDDTPVEAVAWLFRALRATRAPLGSPPPWESQLAPVPIVCTGRPEEYREVTERWLLRYSLAIPTRSLYMRRDGDSRDDTIVKLEMLRQLRVDGFEPILVVDDRDKIVAMWRRQGLTCLQCAPGDF